MMVKDKIGNAVKGGQTMYWASTQSIVRVLGVGEEKVQGKSVAVVRLELSVAMVGSPVLNDFIVVQTPEEAKSVDDIVERASASIPIRPELVRPR